MFLPVNACNKIIKSVISFYKPPKVNVNNLNIMRVRSATTTIKTISANQCNKNQDQILPVQVNYVQSRILSLSHRQVDPSNSQVLPQFNLNLEDYFTHPAPYSRQSELKTTISKKSERLPFNIRSSITERALTLESLPTSKQVNSQTDEHIQDSVRKKLNPSPSVRQNFENVEGKNTSVSDLILKFNALSKVNEQPKTSKLKNTIIFPVISPLPPPTQNSPSNEKNVIKLLMSQKDKTVKKQEEDAVRLLKFGLSNEIPIQKELLALSDEELQILLSSTYVEKSHKLHPLIAYNTPDNEKLETKVDDNVSMLQAYSIFITDLNKILNASYNEDLKITMLSNSIKKVLGMLYYGNANLGIYMNELRHSFWWIPIKHIKNGNELFNLTKNGEANCNLNKLLSVQIENFNYNINLSYEDANEDYLKVYSSVDPERKNNMINTFARKLYNAYLNKSMVDIFKLTSDFMYLHMIPNANGRASQIIRDSFALMLNQAPFPALTSMSHYINLDTKPTEKHLEFMQAIFIEKLDAIKNGRFDDLMSEEKLQILLSKYETDPDITLDYEYYKFIGINARSQQ